ncbi:zinc finger protein 558-like [Agrilus planipennis]|uniref:Zinc finger protein 558-like n=1 Tax=Agrilus planipennis TaxID=224129 RepID=A0A1W4XIW1_AGRPL|nr:zinc finger protein 558-like [Agrilus planipennis]
MECNDIEKVDPIMDITCRICSETFDKGFHILGEEGKRRNLHAKIRRYLYITVSTTDRLPKIICVSCYCKIESFHNFVLMANKNQVKFTFSAKDGQDTCNIVKQKSVSLLESYLTRGTKEFESEKEGLEELEVEVDPMWFLEGGIANQDIDDDYNSSGAETKSNRNTENAQINQTVPENEFYSDDEADIESDKEELISKRQIKVNDNQSNNIFSTNVSIVKNNKEIITNNNERILIGSVNVSSCPPTNEIMAEIENNNRCEINRRAHSCEICFRRFNSEVALHNHIWTHSRQTKHPSDQRETENNDENLPLPGHSIFTDVENNGVANNENSCPICGKVVSTRGNLKVHLETHRPKGKYGCDSCGRIFKTQCNLQRHQRYHDGVKYSCEVCGRVYSTNSTLRAHAVTHSELRPHECPLCEKKFKRNQDLKFHINQHTGAKPYRCPYCPKAFASSGNCFSHRKRMHPAEVERDREKAAKFM